MLYSYAKLSKNDFGFVRILGSGLGNLLFPWARSIVANKKYALNPIAPTWFQIKLGPILRREKDFRLYNDLFITPEKEIVGIKKIFLLLTQKKLDESLLLNLNPEALKNYRNKIFIFSGLRNYFKDILKDNGLIKDELFKMTKDVHKTGLEYDFTNCVSVHIRRGDFKIEGWDTSTEWFLQIMEELRTKLGPNLKFKIFSDGTDEELSMILKQKNTERLFFGSALADLLAMSCSKILVGSYNSTFSMWASYLGRMPTIWPEKGLFQKLHYEHLNNEIEVSYKSTLPELFIVNCKKML